MSITCPNKSSEAWRLLVASRGETMSFYLWNKYNGEVPDSESKESVVKAAMRALTILQSPNAFATFAKGKKNGWDLEKILTELQVPTAQKGILLSLGINDREQLALELGNQYSYVIEVNTAKDVRFVKGRDGFELPGGEWIEYENQDYEDIGNGENSQYYSNMTVPGGAIESYEENNIDTPAITPSIKGHASFQTNSSVGWFRSDTRDSQSFEQLLSQGLIKEVEC